MLAEVGKEMVCANLCVASMRDQILCQIVPSWPPLLALIWGTKSRDPVQLGYRCMRTLISLGLRVSILLLSCSR
jgi:hypothetical protein